MPALKYLGQIGSAYPVGVGVSAAKPKMESVVRTILDRLAAQGVLETLRRKWAGDLPPLKVTIESTDASASAVPSETTETSATP
jgi:hypothetical protein